MTSKELQDTIQAFLEERGWLPLEVEDLAKSISIEAAELLEHFQWTSVPNNKTKTSNSSLKSNPVKRGEILDEVADILNYAMQICIMLDVDFKDVILAKLEKVKKKYPKEMGRDADAYNKIKKEYRSK